MASLVMGKKSVVMLVVYALVMVAVVVGVTIFRSFMLARFLANVGIVLLFGAFYLRFLRP